VGDTITITGFIDDRHYNGTYRMNADRLFERI
jgi:hypothetical protein